MSTYRVSLSDEFIAELRKEVLYSRKQWGDAHSKQYFAELELHCRSVLGSAPSAFSRPRVPGTGYLKWKGHLILFEIDERQKEVRLLDLYGRHRYFELYRRMEGGSL
ncbi:MAG: type II toxin-antitoxin system RelE/ParE family toxin [Verrucomicrobiota bacterium JB022]|nr:type II toxin-antitoxin system RelE/ParE family toxin [Verrucomicrobiota bacterium JB022]